MIYDYAFVKKPNLFRSKTALEDESGTLVGFDVESGQQLAQALGV